MIPTTGTVYDSSFESQPLEIVIGSSGIKGWDEALSGACKGEKRTVFIPAELAYGEKGPFLIRNLVELVFTLLSKIGA